MVIPPGPILQGLRGGFFLKLCTGTYSISQSVTKGMWRGSQVLRGQILQLKKTEIVLISRFSILGVFLALPTKTPHYYPKYEVWAIEFFCGRIPLTLVGPRGGRGHICPPCQIFAYISANTRTSGLKKLEFSQVWKRAVRFYPIKLSRFAEKNEVGQNFIRGYPYELCQEFLCL